ncbi:MULTISPECIES: leucine-rich repeat domain-containing protein [Bacteroidales]|uniref:Leucine-rich repeat protein n=1 Tax=Xylanibacter muris TaxID=2736290 RepID=A0ABX2AM35_9BACT|nr:MULTISPECIES: leucine-rich repeat domain-containing protein [Bacteroidales]NPD92180.1 leucine-rich repeat protein [Xylanibacter muris]
MKKTIITYLALFASVFAVGQNIKVISKMDDPIQNPDFFQKALGSEWAEIDSLVITYPYPMLGDKEFRLLRKCCEKGRLSGINLTHCGERDIPDNAFSTLGDSDKGNFLKSNLKYVSLPQALKKIGVGAFAGTGLRCIDIPRTVVSVGPQAFGRCPELRSVTIRGNKAMTCISKDAFSGSSSNAVLNVFTDAYDYYVDSETYKGFKGINADATIYKDRTIHIDGSRTAKDILGADAYDIDSLTVTGTPNSDDFEFICSLSNSCNGRLHGLNLFDCDIQEMSDDCFGSGVNKILNIVLPKNLRRIGHEVFSYSMLENISFPPTLKEIGIFAFYECRYLCCDLKLPEGLDYIAYQAFWMCVNLKSIYLPSTLERLGVQAFYNPYYVEGIEDGPDVYINRRTPPVEVDYAGEPENNVGPVFGARVDSWRLFVPVGAKKNYENLKHWFFSEIIETPELTGGPNGIDGAVVSSDTDSGVTEVYTVSGRLVWRGMGEPQLSKGLYIMKTGGKAEKRVVE